MTDSYILALKLNTASLRMV